MRLPSIATRTDTLFPYTTLFLSWPRDPDPRGDVQSLPAVQHVGAGHAGGLRCAVVLRKRRRIHRDCGVPSVHAGEAAAEAAAAREKETDLVADFFAAVSHDGSLCAGPVQADRKSTRLNSSH